MDVNLTTVLDAALTAAITFSPDVSLKKDISANNDVTRGVIKNMYLPTQTLISPSTLLRTH